jgi:DNA-directed RNA polymerase specialized sigma24 family protein
MDKLQTFKQVEKLIYNQAWYYSRKYNVEFEDVKSQAFEIFCKALEGEKYNPARSSFSTYLFYQLKRLNYYCKKQNRLLPETDIEDTPHLYVEDSTLDRLIFFSLVEELSEDGREVVQGLVYGDFFKPEDERHKAVGITRLKEILTRKKDWKHSRVDDVWKELNDWYKKYLDKE